MALLHFPVYLLHFPHIAEEVSFKSRILKVETVLCYSLQSAKYQNCFIELTNLFCKEEMDRLPASWTNARRRKKKKIQSPASTDIL